ncbi:hypothetical protein P167DRAFT_534980 [Morchella conica CCBAS932]|uniref:MOSC domain-containing protein n=1 Tax=Morchella conica CCBAS932 TaxID=1392247 RepID=A0A3N4L6M7_9PEZI|nr:hypothetical protein P167DRAFT_534980 [Morchella conica CCBAS932]
MKIDKLFIHPIKSILPIPVSSATITPNGLQHDRTFMLIRVDPEDGKVVNLTVKDNPELCLFQPSLSDDLTSLHVTHKSTPSCTPITIPLTPTFAAGTKTYPISICDTSTTGYDMGPEASLFFSTYLKYPAHLVHIGPSHRSTIPTITPSPQHPQGISFADVAPILLATDVSLKDVSNRAGEDFDITKFRPNIYVDTTSSGVDAYDEELWAEVEVRKDGGSGEAVRLDMTFNTPRCTSINVDYATGKAMPPEKQVYKKLMKDRRINPEHPFSPCFGKYGFCEQFGQTINVGDEIKVTKRNQERHVSVHQES